MSNNPTQTPPNHPAQPSQPQSPNQASQLPTPDNYIDDSLPHPDTFEEFIELGDAAPNQRGQPGQQSQPQLPEINPQPQSQSPPSPPRTTASFFTGLFSKAHTTLESTLSTAQRDLTNLSSDLLPTAHQNISNASNTALATVTTLVADMTRPAQPPPPSPPDPFTQLNTTPKPACNTPLKSLNVGGDALLYVLLDGGVLVIVTHVALWRFTWGGVKLAHAPFNITWSADGAHAVSTPVPPSGASVFRNHATGKPVRAVSAVRVGDEDEVLVGHEDGALRLYAIGGERFGVVVRTGRVDEGAPAVMSMLKGRPRRVAVGYNDGVIRVIGCGEVEVEDVIEGSEICMGGFGRSGGYAGVSCVWPGEREGVGIWGGFEDGGVVGSVIGGGGLGGKGFVAHGRRVGGGVMFLDGVLALTVGNEADPSLAVFEGEGRCLVRRMLPYVPSFVTRVEGGDGILGSSVVCPSEFAFVVGGEEGQVEIFRMVVLGTNKVELRLVRRVSERIRGRDKRIVGVSFLREEGVLMALSKNGELRRWRLTSMDSNALAIRNSDFRAKCTYTEENVAELMTRDFMVDEDARLSSVGGVIQAQNVLAAILGEETFPEANKDHLVSEFQKSQTGMLQKISQADTDLRRAGRRISARFACGLKPLPTVSSAREERLSRAAKRTAAFEMEFATRRHAETQMAIQDETLASLRIVLLNSLKGIRGSGGQGRVEELRLDVERLGASAQDGEIESRETEASS